MTGVTGMPPKAISLLCHLLRPTLELCFPSQYPLSPLSRLGGERLGIEKRNTQSEVAGLALQSVPVRLSPGTVHSAEVWLEVPLALLLNGTA